jgi:hypothetical protein
LIIKYNKNRLFIFLFIFLFKFLKQIKFKQIFNNNTINKIGIKKNLFFKKKYNPKTLASKRLSIVLRKRKKLKNFKIKKTDKGNFYFKKFFFKTLLKTRKYLRRFFFFNNKTRQTKITKSISRNSKMRLLPNNYELTIFNTLLRSHFCLFLKDVLILLKNGFIYLNGVPVTQYDTILNPYDCLQLRICKYTYKYIQSSKKFLKKKLSAFRLSSWKFFKQKFFRQQQQLKPLKRKTPKYLYLFFLFKLNTPKYLEIDYFSLTILILKPLDVQLYTTYYINKFFSYRLFSLYNFKKIN